MTKLIPALALFAALWLCPTPASAQTTEAARQQKADELNIKLRKIDLYNQILPILLTKEQAVKLLPVIEKARKAVKDTEAAELEGMKKLENKLDAALKDAKEKSAVPTRELIKEISDMIRAFQVRRLEVIGTNTDNVAKALEPVLNAGQKKAITNALDMRSADGVIDTTKLTDEQKFRFFVQTILLDPLAYEILLEISQRKDG